MINYPALYLFFRWWSPSVRRFSATFLYFCCVLAHSSERSLWQQYTVGKYNTSPQGAGQVLAAIKPALVERFNDTLSHQWDVYSHAVELYTHR